VPSSCQGFSVNIGRKAVERKCWRQWVGHIADYEAISIREFCELPTPIIMFDKDGAFVVMKLEKVRFLSRLR
jgi:hypothetical protein